MQMAQEAGLNDAQMYYTPADPLLAHIDVLPHLVVITGDSHLPHQASLNPDFARTPLSYSIATRIKGHTIHSKIPLIWTRGLQADGTWSTDSPYQGKGGYIGFMDGHVEWFSQLKGRTALVDYHTGQPTCSIQAALPQQALILNL